MRAWIKYLHFNYVPTMIYQYLIRILAFHAVCKNILILLDLYFIIKSLVLLILKFNLKSILIMASRYIITA